MSLSLNPNTFWRSTPRVIGIVMTGAGQRLAREQDDRIAQAWMTVALSRAQRLPKLETLLGAGQKRQQTWQDQLATVKMINAAFGGNKR